MVVYCRIGERSSHTWFVLQHLLGFGHVRNYDGSWTEWGNSVRVPITRGDEPVTSQPVSGAALHPRLQEIVDDFRDVPDKDRLQLLLEFSQDLPPLPERYAEHRDRMEPVPECQTPLFLAVEVEPDETVHLYFDAPPRRRPPAASPPSCTPGSMASDADEVLATPPEFSSQLGLARPGEPAAAARHGRDAVPDQAPGAGAAGRTQAPGSRAVSCWALTCAQSR